MIKAICVLGRGIEKVSTTFGERWRPTRYIELLSSYGWHTGRRDQTIDPNDGRSVIAGSNANVIAAAHLYCRLATVDEPPRLVIFAAGRPNYLADDPDPLLTEGKIMTRVFFRKAAANGNLTDVVILGKNKNTRDDTLETFAACAAHGARNIIFLTTEVHLSRTMEFVGFVRKMRPEFAHIDACFLASEAILLARYAAHPRYRKMLAYLRNSRAFARTKVMEERGIERLKKGAYGLSSQGYAFGK